MKPALQAFGSGGVKLRPLSEADLDLTLSWRNRDDVRFWFKTPDRIDPGRHRAWFAQYALRDDDFVFVVEFDGAPVGQASVYGINRAERTAEVGRFVAAPEARGSGLMDLACAELVRFCADTLQLASVYLEVKEDNARAIALYLRQGFAEEGRREGIVRMRRSLARHGSRG
ncbi:MAG: GNAT family N-acetyltransferase [Bryobacteraceae bacterium]